MLTDQNRVCASKRTAQDVGTKCENQERLLFLTQYFLNHRLYPLIDIVSCVFINQLIFHRHKVYGVFIFHTVQSHYLI